jgi:hypothetical protein
VFLGICLNVAASYVLRNKVGIFVNTKLDLRISKDKNKIGIEIGMFVNGAAD